MISFAVMRVMVDLQFTGDKLKISKRKTQCVNPRESLNKYLEEI